MGKQSFLKIALLVAVIAPVVVVVSWGATEMMIEETGGKEFCTVCHTMQPMGVAYEADIHGGANNSGVKAKCVDCHLPHDNPFVYLYGKASIGFHDVWAQMTYDLDAIDWQAKREHREDFVYDSGCMHCHSNLEKATLADSKAFVAHKPYFLGKTEKSCVSCHTAVGHKNLSAHLERSGS